MAMTVDQMIALELQVCINSKCGFSFALPKTFLEQCRRNTGGYYCPICQTLQGWWKKPEDQEKKELERQLAIAKAQVNRSHDEQRRLVAEVKHYEAKVNGYKGQLALLKKRIANGVCPCCNRYFAALHQHMLNKHMPFLEESGIIQAIESTSPEDFDRLVDQALAGLAPSTAGVYRNAATRIRGFMFPEGKTT